MEVILILTITILICYWYWKYLITDNKLPPGPIGIPILGYLPFLSKRVHIDFSMLKQKYGNVFSLYIGQKLVVVLSTHNVIKEAFRNRGNIFSGRPVMISGIPPEFNKAKGIAFNEGKSWIEVKKFTVNSTKKFIYDNRGTSIIKNEIMLFLNELKKMNGKPTDIEEIISVSIANILWVFLFGDRNNYNDEKFRDILKSSHKHVMNLQYAGLEIVFPWIAKIPFSQMWIRPFAAFETYRHIHKYFTNKVQEIEEKLSHNFCNKFYFTSDWFEERKRNKTLSERNLFISVLIDLILAGSDTLSTYLQWAVLYMAEYPKIQEKVQQEIENVVGENKSPTMHDLKHMPFTNAVIIEIHRIVSLIPIVPHVNVETTTLQGYVIPKDSIVIANFWDNNHDLNIFPNPDEFCPERFLENGVFKNIPELMPFSIGKRQCIGESLARLVIFLYFTSMLQNFKFKKYVAEKLKFHYKFMPMMCPRPQKVCVIARRENIIF